MTEDMENIETTNDDLEKFKQKYEVTWLNEIKITIYFSVGIILLCGVLFVSLFFTRGLVKDVGTINRYISIFEKTISPASMEQNLKNLTSKPHYPGTPEGDDVARDLAKQLKKVLGENVKVYNETYRVLIPRPDGPSSLTFTSNNSTVSASLFESPIAGPVPKNFDDPSYSFWNKSWLAFSKSGVATGKLLYVNYGRVEDFTKLASRVNLAGTVVIARYGKIFRGNIVRTAEQYKCAGVILYSDPADDGSSVGSVYPQGPWRPETSLQRGSVMYLADQPGDPTTPGYPSLPNQRRRIERSEATNLPKIPVVAISSSDAFKFLKQLDGDVVEEDWKGGLTGEGFSYKYGTLANPGNVKLDVKLKEEMVDIHNIFARIEGRVEPEKFVMVGNHRDPWTFGAVDPHSGTVVLLELAKSLGELIANRWRPRRSLIIAFWDAEEQGLIGSTEFVEQYKENLRQQCLAYINVDSYYGDKLNVVGSASLGEVVIEASKLIPHPNGTTLFDSWNSTNVKTEKPVPTLVGSGSDYTAFYHHVGIPILDLSFKQSNGKMYGAYHSIIDNFEYFTNYIDPGFKLGEALTKLLGRVLFRLIDDIVLDYHIQDQSESIRTEVIAIKNSQDYKNVFEKLNIEQQTAVSVALSIVERASSAFFEAGESVHKEFNSLRNLEPQSLNYETKVRSYNDRVAFAERGFVSNDGLPGRPWYKHVISAPGRDLGYGFEVFPSVKEALRAPTLNESYHLLLNAFSDLSDSIESATSFVTGTFSNRNTQTV